MAKWARLYALLLAAAAVLLAIWLPQGGRIETDFAALLPADAGIDELWRAADQANERALNGQILLLVGASDAEQAIAAAENTARQWRQSGLFAAVDSRINPDLDALRAQIRALGVNALGLAMLLLAAFLVPVVLLASWGEVPADRAILAPPPGRGSRRRHRGESHLIPVLR